MSEEDGKARARARLGTTVREKYRLDQVLGIGGMATVYAATHRNKKRFALKMLHTELSQNEEIRKRFQREGYVANSVGHAGAVTVLDDDVAEDGSAFIVMELLEGDVLENIAERDGKLPPQVVLAVCYEALDVLSAAHGKNIVHRDIKPANIFLTTTGQVKVLDFGIARMREGQSERSRTQTGMAMGTPAFMAPEQALGRSHLVDARTDVWSVGAMMFALLAKRYVHQADTFQELMVYAATKPAPALRSVVPEIPEGLGALVDKALAFERSDRWESAQEMRDAARVVYQSLFSDPIPAMLGAFMGTQPALARTEPPPRVPTQTGPSRTPPQGASAPLPLTAVVPVVAAATNDPNPRRVAATEVARELGPQVSTASRLVPPRAGVKLYAGIALGVLGLGGAVVWSLTREPPSTGLVSAAAPSATAEVAAAVHPAAAPAPPAVSALETPSATPPPAVNTTAATPPVPPPATAQPPAPARPGGHHPPVAVPPAGATARAPTPSATAKAPKNLYDP